MTRLSYETIQVGDIVGIEYAANAKLAGKKRLWLKTLGEYEVVEDRRCICLKERRGNWFMVMPHMKAIRDFGPNMFILKKRQ